MKFVIDTLGSDKGIHIFIQGALKAQEKNKELEFIFVGPENQIKDSIEKFEGNINRYEYINAVEVIENTEEPVLAIRRKKDSSMVKAFMSLKNGDADAMLSAGSTGALLAGGTLYIGRISGVARPALCVVLPNFSNYGSATILLDVGANVDTQAKLLYSFGVMGVEYAKLIFQNEIIRLGLLNIGAEEGKGSEAVKETYQLFKDSNFNFIGNIEARDILHSKAQVVICDGFAGNIAIKTIEGTALAIGGLLKKEIYSSARTKIGGTLIKPVFSKLKQAFDSDQYGAAPLLGTKKPIFKAHGSSSAEGIEQGIYLMHNFMKNNIIENIKNQFVNKEEKNDL